MPPLTVPERLREGIVQIGELAESAFDQLQAALASAPDCEDRKQLSAWIGGETSEIPSATREEILRVLTSMSGVQKAARVTTQKFSADVWQSLVSAEPKRFVHLDGDVLRNRIALLLKQKALDTAASRISGAKVEVERNFCKAQVMTDLRPAFRSDLASVPTEMAVIHNLQIGYHDGMGKHHEFYLSLDGKDLQDLKTAIVDAEKRAEALETVFRSTNIKLHK